MNLRDPQRRAFSDADLASVDEDEDENERSNVSNGSDASPGPPPRPSLNESRHWRDLFWLVVFVIHLLAFGPGLALLGINHFSRPDRFNIDRFTNITGGGNSTQDELLQQQQQSARVDLTETYWPFYGVAGGAGALLAWSWLSLLGTHGSQMMKVSIHGLTTYLAVVSVLCFWVKHFFWGVAFAVGAALQFLYVMSVLERFPFTMLVLQKAVKMLWNLPEVMRVAYAFVAIMLCWMGLWSFGISGVLASSMDDSARWWLLVVSWQVCYFQRMKCPIDQMFKPLIKSSCASVFVDFAVSLFWIGAVFCNTVHVIVSGMVFLVLINGSRTAPSMPLNPVLKSLRYAVTTSFGSICYGSLFTAAIRALRWEIRGVRSKIGSNECLLCCVDFLFHLVETLVRFFNKYAYVEIAVNGKGFNSSARDAWELFQSTGIEALVAYDCSGAVLLMSIILGGMITGTCTGVWTWFKRSDKVIMVGSTSILMGMILVGLAVVVVESAVTSIYVCFAEDPSLIQRWDAEFFDQMSEALHQRLQYRSARAREVMNRQHDQLADSPI